jgi:hypothetical protein
MALDTRVFDHPPPDLTTVVALARDGLTLQAIGQRFGRSRGRIHQLLKAHNLRIAELRDIRCAACGERLSKAELTTRSGRHYHSRPACDPAYEREQRAAARRERRRLEGIEALALAERGAWARLVARTAPQHATWADREAYHRARREHEAAREALHAALAARPPAAETEPAT